MAVYTCVLYSGVAVIDSDTIIAPDETRAVAQATRRCERDQWSTGFDLWHLGKKVHSFSRSSESGPNRPLSPTSHYYSARTRTPSIPPLDHFGRATSTTSRRWLCQRAQRPRCWHSCASISLLAANRASAGNRRGYSFAPDERRQRS